MRETWILELPEEKLQNAPGYGKLLGRCLFLGFLRLCRLPQYVTLQLACSFSKRCQFFSMFKLAILTPGTH